MKNKIIISVSLMFLLSFSITMAVDKNYKDSVVKTTIIKDTVDVKSQVIVNTPPVIVKSSSDIKAGEQIDWYVISSGGQLSSSSSYKINGTIGQPVIGIAQSKNYMINSGYWQSFSSGICCIGYRGNIDNSPDDLIDIADLVYMVNYFYIGGTAPPCFEEADLDANGIIDISDIVYLINYMYGGGAVPLPC